MANILQILPMLDGEEQVFIQGLIKDMNESAATQFAQIYASRRKDPQTILLTCLLGFIVVAGVHRFLLGQVGMGLLYVFTGGLCLIGTIIDLVNYKKMTFEYNAKIAQQVAVMVKASN